MKKLLQVLSLAIILVIQVFGMQTRAEETQRIQVDILTVDKEENGDDKLTYWTGETIQAQADLQISGTGVNITNAKTVLRVKKENIKYLDTDDYPRPTNPLFVKSGTASSWEITEDENDFIVTYHFDRLAGGTRITIPFPFHFKTGVTPNGFQVTPTYELFDSEGQSLGKAEVTYTAKTSTWKPSKAVTSWYSSDGDLKTVVDYNNDDPNQTTAEGTKVYYTVGFRNVKPEGVDNANFGYYKPKTITFTDKLPAAAELDAESIEKGWVYDAQTHSATWTGVYNPDTRSFGAGSEPYQEYDSAANTYRLSGLNVPIYLRYKNTPNESIHTNTVTVVAENGTDNEVVVGDASADVKLVVRQYERSGYFSISKTWGTDYYFVPKTNVLKDSEGKVVDKLEYNIYVYQWNNGSGPEDRENGIENILYKVTDYDMDSNNGNRLYYKGVEFVAYESSDNNKFTEADFKAGNPVLYGVKEDGTRVELARNFGFDQEILINDTIQQFKKVEVEFENGIRMNRQSFRMKVYAYPMPEEYAKWENGEYKLENYNNSAQADYSTIEDPNTHLTTGSGGQIRIKKPDPKMSMYFYDDYIVPYGDDNKRSFTLQAYAHDTDWRFSDEKPKNLRQVVLLPDGINLVEESVSTSTGSEPKFEIVNNFAGTGKRAVIFYHDTRKFGNKENESQYSNYYFELDTTIYTKEGENPIVAYTIWDNNDYIKGVWDNVVYDDQLDLDEDGNTTEKFLKASRTITFIPPFEVLSKKYVSNDMQAWAFIGEPQDIGKEFYYRLDVLNNSVGNIRNLYILDVFPYIGDHKIAANAEGQYLPRNSQFETPMVMALEDIPENAAVLQKFDVYYSLVRQGADVESVNQGPWLRKEEVNDFTAVQNIKIVMKDGVELLPKEEVRFISKHKLPLDRSIVDGPTAKNSIAISGNGSDYIEANEVVVSSITYEVKGTIFKDFGADGTMNKQDDPVRDSTYEVELIDMATGQVAVDELGNQIKTKVKADGTYSLKTYFRGEYKVRVIKPEGDQYTPVSNNDLDGNNVTSPDTGETDVFKLSPAKRIAIKNAGIKSINRSLKVLKTSALEDEFNVKKPLEGVEFALYRADDLNTVLDTKKTDKDGLLAFENLVFGEYVVKEVKTITGYILDEKPITVTLNADTPVQVVENQPMKQGIKLTKVDSVDHSIKLQGVEFSLYKENTWDAIQTKTSDENGIVQFDPVYAGKYYVRETDTLDQYDINYQQLDVEVLADSEETIDLGLFENRLKHRTFTIQKVDEETREPIANTEFKIYKENDLENAVGTYVTYNDGKAYPYLPLGNYVLVESKPAFGYAAKQVSYPITIEETNEIFVVENTKKNRDVILTKVDADNPNIKLAGVKFELEPTQWDVRDQKHTAVTDADGRITFKDVKVGEYKLKELETNKGYILNEEVIITIPGDEDGVYDLGNITNRKFNGTIRIKKIDGDTEEPIEGVEFSLTATIDNTDINIKKLTNAEGVIEFTGLAEGYYSLLETKPKDGYTEQANTWITGISIYQYHALDEYYFTNPIRNYKLKATVIVRHLNEYGDALSPEEIVKNRVPLGTEYETSAGNFDGYVFKEMSADSDLPKGTADKDYTIVTYIYRREKNETGNVYVKHITDDGQVLSEKEVVVENGPVDSLYDTQVRTFEGYWFSHLDENSAPGYGTVKLEDQTVIYVYTKIPEVKTGNVYEKHITEDGTVLSDVEGVYINGQVGSNYSVRERSFKDYQFVRLEDGSAPKDGQVQEGDQTVVFVYAKKDQPTVPAVGTVYAKHITVDGEVLSDTEVVIENGTIGDRYYTFPRSFNGYQFVRLDDQSADQFGLVKEEEQTVIFVYDKYEPVKTGSVFVKHIAEDGTVLSEREEVMYNVPVGDAYKTDSRNFVDYEFVKWDENSAAQNGLVVEGEQVVIYIYRKKVTPPQPPVEYIPPQVITEVVPPRPGLPNTGTETMNFIPVGLLLAGGYFILKRNKEE